MDEGGRLKTFELTFNGGTPSLIGFKIVQETALFCRTALAVFDVVSQNLAVYGYLVQCCIHYPPSSHKHRTLHLHFKPAYLPQHRHDEKSPGRHFCSVALCACYDNPKTSALGRTN